MIELSIDRLTFGGRGVGRHDGKALFVPHALPGERVACRITREQKRYAEAELVEVIEPHPSRVDPPCPHFGRCGGCQWQMLPYGEQLAAKQELLQSELLRQLPIGEGQLRPIVAAPDPWNYRCRAQVKCRQTADGFVAGFYRSGSHYVVDFESCPLLADPINVLLQSVKPLLASSRLANRIPQLDFAVDHEQGMSLIVHCLEDAADELRTLLAATCAEHDCGLYLQVGRKSTLKPLLTRVEQQIAPLADDPLRLYYPAGSFVQVNLAQNQQLVAAACEATGAANRVADLYCGIGNFSLPLARRCGTVVGIEDYAPAIAAATVNAERLGFDNTSFFAEPAEKGLVKRWPPAGFDAVLLDPPRAGAYEVARQLVDLKPEKIVYVSCDPSTLIRDLKLLLHNGFSLQTLQAFDMFPQTWHVESLAVLRRNG